MSELTKNQEKALREFLHEAVVPLIEDVLVKKLGQAMLYAKEQLDTPKPWVGLTESEQYQIAVACGAISADWLVFIRATEAKLKEKNNAV